MSWLPKETMWNGTVAGICCLDTFNMFIMLIIWFPKAPPAPHLGAHTLRELGTVIVLTPPSQPSADFGGWQRGDNDKIQRRKFLQLVSIGIKKGCRCLPHVLSSKFHAANLSSNVIYHGQEQYLRDGWLCVLVPSSINARSQGRFIDTPSAQNQW